MTLPRLLPATLLALSLSSAGLADEKPQVELPQPLPTDIVLYDLEAKRTNLQERLGPQATVFYMLTDADLLALAKEAQAARLPEGEARAPEAERLSPAHAALRRAQRTYGEDVTWILLIRAPIVRYAVPEGEAPEVIEAMITAQRQESYQRLNDAVEVCDAFGEFTVLVDEGSAMAARIGAEPTLPAVLVADARRTLCHFDAQDDARKQSAGLTAKLDDLLGERSLPASAKRKGEAETPEAETPERDPSGDPQRERD